MRIAKRILIGLAALIAILFFFLLFAPMLFKDRIIREVKAAANENLNATVDFADADVSFLRHFPEVSLTVEDYSIVGVDTFAGLPLVTGEEARVDLGFWSVLAGDGNYKIDAVTLDQPRVNLLVLSPELANYLIVPEDEGAVAGAADTSASAVITLDHYEINDGYLVYDDRTTETYLKIEGLTTTGDGDFTASVFDLATQAEADKFTLTQGGITYLDEVHMAVDALVNVNADELRYTFTEAVGRINELDLNLDGSIDLEDNDDIIFDLTYSAPANDFRQLWSLIPSAYTEGYERVQTAGTFTLNGTVQGPFNSEREVYPAFTVNSEIAGGSVQYPGRPVGINGIDAALAVNSPSSDLDALTVDIPRFNFTLGGDPFRGSFRLATPLSDPNVSARLDGTVDLEKWAAAVPLEGVRELGGRIVADINAENVRQSAIDAGRYAEVNLAGDVRVSNLVYVAEGTPPARVAQARAEFSPQFVELQQFTANLGRSDVSATGRIDNILAYFNPEQTMRGRLQMQSNYFNADEWMETEQAATDSLRRSPAELNAVAAEAETGTEVFDRFDFDIDASIDELVYGDYQPTDLRVTGNVKPNRLEIANAGVTLDESTFSGSGVVRNLFDYTFADGILAGNLNLRAGYFNLNDFIPAETSASPDDTAPAAAPESESAVIPVPNNINLTVDLAADRVQYTDITMNDVRGVLRVQDGAVMIEDGNANLLGGSMGLRGTYDTAEDGLPGFHFAYDIRNFDFGQAFGALNSFAALAPIGKFVSGNFSSELVMEGKLGEDLLPQLTSIDAQGLLRTAEARIASFKPLQVVGRALNVKELADNATLRNIIAAFEINDGQVTVDPFDFRLAGLEMQLGGTHGLDTDMDYTLQAAVPRTMIEGNIVGGNALGVLDVIAGQASRLGVDVDPGDTLNLAIGLTGSLSNPRANVDLLGILGGGETTTGTVAEAAEERLREEANTRIDSARAVAEARTEEIKDTLRTAAEQQADRLKDEATDAVRDAIGLGRSDTTTARRDTLPLPGAAKDAVEEAKKKLEEFNPFRRRKSGGGL